MTSPSPVVGSASIEQSDVRLMQRAMLALKQAWRALPDGREHEELISACDDIYSELQARLGRDGEHCMCPACKDGKLHASDCAVHNEPAMPIGPCDCKFDALAPARKRTRNTLMNESTAATVALSGVELKPCPFCGCPHIGYWGDTPYCIRCNAMGPSNDDSDTKEKNAAAWNHRAAPPATA